MEVELTRKHWEDSLEGHSNMILQSKMNLILATEAYKKCEEELKKFPEKKNSMIK